MNEIILHANESEQAVIGGLLLDFNVASEQLGGLRAEHFWSEAHREIFTQILAMKPEDVDVLLVADALEARGLTQMTGGLAYLADLTANTPSPHTVRRHAERIVEKAMERELLAAADKVKGAALGIGTTAQKLAQAQSAVMGITEAMPGKQAKSTKELLTGFVATMDARAQGEQQGIFTGFSDLDRKIALRPGNLIIIAGRPSMGKTTLAVNIGANVAGQGKTVAILSLEMSDAELTDRLISSIGGVPLEEVLKGTMDGDEGMMILSASQRLIEMPIYIDDQGSLTAFDVASKARSIKRKHGLDLLVIDYLQLMVGVGDNRNQEIEGITRAMKALAKELNIPIILLSQLSRKCEERTNKRPMMSDLRESGAIEQDADVILMVYRDEKYNPDSPYRGTAEILIEKQRQGSTGISTLAFQGEKCRFVDLSVDWHPEVVESPKKRRGRDDF